MATALRRITISRWHSKQDQWKCRKQAEIANAKLIKKECDDAVASGSQTCRSFPHSEDGTGQLPVLISLRKQWSIHYWRCSEGGSYEASHWLFFKSDIAWAGCNVCKYGLAPHLLWTWPKVMTFYVLSGVKSFGMPQQKMMTIRIHVAKLNNYSRKRQNRAIAFYPGIYWWNSGKSSEYTPIK